MAEGDYAYPGQLKPQAVLTLKIAAQLLFQCPSWKPTQHIHTLMLMNGTTSHETYIVLLICRWHMFVQTARHAHLKAVWCGVIWRVNHPGTVDEAVQRFLSGFEFLSTLLD